jgi:hypothetical protein
MSQVLELVELAIFEAYREASATESSASSALAETQETSEEYLDVDLDTLSAEIEGDSQAAEAKTSSNAKRKARKKRNKLIDNIGPAISPAAGSHSKMSVLADIAEDEPIFDIFEEGDIVPPLPSPAYLGSLSDAKQLAIFTSQNLNEVDGFKDWAVLAPSCKKAACSDLVSQCSFEETTQAPSTVDFPGPPEGEVCLNFDWSPEGPPIDVAQDGAAVELEVDWSEGGSHVSWSAWLPNGLTGCAAEWHWVSGPPMVAFFKNTFVETADVLPEERARSKSLPARPPPVEL